MAKDEDKDWKPVEPATDEELESWLSEEGWKDFDKEEADG